MKSLLVSQVVRTASKGLTVLLLTRVFLTPDEYGILFLTISVLAIAIMGANLGLAKSGARYLAEYRETGPGQVPHIIRKTLQYNLVSIGLTVAVLALAHRQIAALVGEPIGELLLLGTGYIAAKSLWTFHRLTFQGFSRVSLTALVSVIGNVSQILVVVGLLVLGFGVAGVIMGYIVSSLVAVVVGFYILYTRFYVPFDEGEPMESGLGRKVLRYSIPLTATRGANVLDKRVDTVLVGYFINPTAVAFYQLSKQITDFVGTPARTLGFTISPTFGELKAADEIDRAARVYERTFENIVLLYIPAMVGLIIVAEPAIRIIFGAEYLGAVRLVQIFSGLMLLEGLGNITNDGLDYVGRARDRAVAKGATSVGNFLLNLAMIPLFGVVGAGVATLVTQSVLVGLNLVFIYQEFPIRFSRLLGAVARTCSITVIVALPVLALKPAISGIVTLVGTVLVGVGIWAVLSVFVGLLDLREVQAVVRS